MHVHSRLILIGRFPVSVATVVLALGMAFAAETRIPLPPGFDLTSTEGVATTGERHALALREQGATVASRVLQVTSSGTVLTDLEGVADLVEYSADRTHLLVRQTLPEADPRRGAHLYSLIDNVGEVVWSTASRAAYRFTAGGSLLYVAQFPGATPHIRVFDLRGNLLRAIHPERPYLDARVLDDGEEALVLFSGPRARSSDPRAGHEVSVARVRLEENLPSVWSVALDPDALKYPEMVPLDRDWVLITTRRGFVAVHRDGRSTTYDPDPQSGDATESADFSSLRLASGAGPDTLILYDLDRALVLDLAADRLRPLTADPNSRFENAGYRDRHVVLERPGEVILKPLGDAPDSTGNSREPVSGKPRGRSTKR